MVDDLDRGTLDAPLYYVRFQNVEYHEEGKDVDGGCLHIVVCIVTYKFPKYSCRCLVV